MVVVVGFVVYICVPTTFGAVGRGSSRFCDFLLIIDAFKVLTMSFDKSLNYPCSFLIACMPPFVMKSVQKRRLLRLTIAKGITSTPPMHGNSIYALNLFLRFLRSQCVHKLGLAKGSSRFHPVHEDLGPNGTNNGDLWLVGRLNCTKHMVA